MSGFRLAPGRDVRAMNFHCTERNFAKTKWS
jgi:hypothetical protein